MEWAIKWWNKYRTDFFFRSQVDIIILQIVFTLVVFTVFVFILRFVEQSITETIGVHIAEIFTSNEPVTNFNLEETLQETQENTLMHAMAIVIGVTGLFGYIMTRVTLSPAQKILDSQKRFISNIAHELRTPLSVLRTNTDVALLDNHIPPATKKTFESNREELERISEIINNLLSLTATVQPEQIQFSPVDLGEAAKEAIEKLSPLAKEKQVEIAYKQEVRRQEDRRAVWGNLTGLEQIATNIIRNAVLYTPKGGRVLVSVGSDNHDNVTLLIEDNGVGIAQKELFHIFEPFYRTDQARTRQNTGSGLGLTIASEILKMHRGKITIRSSPGKGTSITIAIPAYHKTSDNVEKKQPEKYSDEVSVDFSRNNIFKT